MTHTPITRRQALAGLGAVGLVAVAPRAVRAARGEPPYTRYTLAQSGAGPDLRVAWYETYNGVYQEDSDGAGGPGLQPTNESFAAAAADGRFVNTEADNPEDAVGGAVVDVGDVLPGDEGRVVVGLLAEDADATVWFRVTVSATPENGRYEPERTDGDTTDDVGELQDALEVSVWYNNGFAGGCNTSLDAIEGERSLPGLSAGDDEPVSLATAAAATAGGVPLDFGLLEGGCLPADTERCLGFRWAFPETADNTTQTDGVSFALEFATVPCGETLNPFDGPEVAA
jgi:hypothetical protein